ncbi:MAG TPA: AMP-binding protein [Candidatus Dormibacteraeota bacterium]|nr:AMP-binding protein [Candidatus Dormibacteraeota bacterium]
MADRAERTGDTADRAASRTAWLAVLDRTRGAGWRRPDDDRFWSRPLDTASRDELRAIQGEKLRAAVRYVYDWIPFYRRRFDRIGLEPGDVRSVDDLEKIPVTTRQDMADDLAESPPWGTYTAVDDRAWLELGWQMFASSGTTGQPRAFRYTALDRDLWAWTDARAMWAMGFRPGRDSAALAFGYGPHVWLWGVHYALNLMGIPIVTAGGLDSRTRVRLVDQLRPTILACTPSYALYLGNLMRDTGLDPAASSVRYLFCAGEPGFSVPSTRRRLEELWQAELHEFYGCTEAAPSAGGYTCRTAAAHRDGPVSTHLMEDTHVWEAVDPETLEPVPAGRRGLSVVTNLVSEASPQLRFLVGDFTTLTHEPCGCGRTHLRAVGGFLGRADDLLNVRGVTLFPSAVEDAVRRVPEVGEEFQLVLTRRDELDVLTVQVEPRPEVLPDRHAELARRVEAEVVSRCELRPEVEVLAYGTLPKTEFKAKRVRDLREP